MLRNTIIEPGVEPVNDNNGPAYEEHVAKALYFTQHGYESVSLHKNRRNLSDFISSHSNDN